MFIKFFKSTGPGVVALIGFLAIAIWSVPLFLLPGSASFISDLRPMPLYSLLKGMAGATHFSGILFSLSMVLLISYLLVSFNTSFVFINERTFLPALFFILLTGFFPSHQVLTPVLPAAVLLMISMRRIMDAYRKNETAYNFFDASFLIGTASLFYANMIWFSLLPLIGIALIRTGNIKELLLALIGVITPLLIVTGIYYISGRDLYQLLSDVNYNLFGAAERYDFTRVTISGLIVVGLIALVSIIQLFSVISTKKIRSRKTFSILTWMFVISLILLFFLPSASVETGYLVSIPLSYFLTHYFLQLKRKVVAEILFLTIFVSIALIQIMAIVNSAPEL